ncbi:MAG: AI-2E family transporter [Bacteroidetes bacterium]|nr:AI-2E family transporter [Bacteroidota bacterium]
MFSGELSKSISRISISIIALITAVYFSYLFFDIILMIAISILLAMIFNPLVKLLESQNINRLVSVLIVFAFSGVGIFFILSILIPKIVSQMNTISVALSKENVDIFLSQIDVAVKTYIPFADSTDVAGKISSFISSLIFDSINNISNIVSSIVSIIAIAVIVPFMTFFILKDNQSIIKGLVNIMPNKYFEVSYWVIWKIREQLGRFVRGWILDAFLVGFMSAIGLSFLGIQNSITIGFIAGVGHLIPYFGPIIGGLPAIIISLIQFGDLSMLPSILILFVIIYTLDNGYIQPNVFSKSTDMHPLVIIILILAGSQLLGIFGMLLAVPVATVIKTAAREIYLGYKNYKIIKLV